jgi:hypothetical protein
MNWCFVTLYVASVTQIEVCPTAIRGSQDANGLTWTGGISSVTQFKPFWVIFWNWKTSAVMYQRRIETIPSLFIASWIKELSRQVITVIKIVDIIFRTCKHSETLRVLILPYNLENVCILCKWYINKKASYIFLWKVHFIHAYITVYF